MSEGSISQKALGQEDFTQGVMGNKRFERVAPGLTLIDSWVCIRACMSVKEDDE